MSRADGVVDAQEPNGTLLSWARELLEAMDEFPTGSDASGHANAQAVGRIAKAKIRIRELIDAADGVDACRAEQRGASEWVCDCAQPGPGCKPTGWRALGVTPCDRGQQG